eukprot:31495-Pelagococcus_subviridis.AAC.6
MDGRRREETWKPLNPARRDGKKKTRRPRRRRRRRRNERDRARGRAKQLARVGDVKITKPPTVHVCIQSRTPRARVAPPDQQISTSTSNSSIDHRSSREIVLLLLDVLRDLLLRPQQQLRLPRI